MATAAASPPPWWEAAGSASSEAVREAASVVRAARPTEAPICRLQLTRPEASPASSWGTPPVASKAIGVKARPIPKVARIPPPQAPVQYESPAWMNESQ